MTEETECLTLTEDKFQREIIEEIELVLAVFSAEWIGPCHMMAPVIEELASDYEGQVKVGKLDVDQTAHIAAQYGIRSTPTLLFFKDGQVVDHVVGVAPKRVLTEKIHVLLQRT